MMAIMFEVFECIMCGYITRGMRALGQTYTFTAAILSWSNDGRLRYYEKYRKGGVPEHLHVTEYFRFVIDSVTV
jgi:hypothetical protein